MVMCSSLDASLTYQQLFPDIFPTIFSCRHFPNLAKQFQLFHKFECLCTFSPFQWVALLSVSVLPESSKRWYQLHSRCEKTVNWLNHVSARNMFDFVSKWKFNYFTTLSREAGDLWRRLKSCWNGQAWTRVFPWLQLRSNRFTTCENAFFSLMSRSQLCSLHFQNKITFASRWCFGIWNVFSF